MRPHSEDDRNPLQSVLYDGAFHDGIVGRTQHRGLAIHLFKEAQEPTPCVVR